MSVTKRLSFILLFASIFISVSCAPAAKPAAAPIVRNQAAEAPQAAAPAQPVAPAAAPAAPAEPAAQAEAPAVDQNNTVYNTVIGGTPAAIAPGTPRKIIKNAELQLLVDDTDVTIDRITQIAVDVGGYIVSSKLWFKDEIGGKYKYSTLTLGVPVDDFERALRRLRETSIQVLNEVTTGEDVSQEYVDLQSKLESLQATRARITGFLAEAKTVEEALQINDQLAAVEQQINETSGRMNFLSGRSAYSSITVTINPKIRDVTATPTLTPTITSTPEPTFTPTPWNPGKTFSSAGKQLGEAYRGMTEVLIWFLVYMVPIMAPWVILVGAIIFLVRGRKKKQPKDEVKKE